MAYPQPGAIGVRGVVERLFVLGSGFFPGQVFGGIVRANWQDWELPGTNDFKFFYQSPLVFQFSGIVHVSEGQACTFDVDDNGGAINVVPA